MRCEDVKEADQFKFIERLSFEGGAGDWDRGCDRDRGRGWKGIRLPEGDSGGRRRHKTEPILSHRTSSFAPTDQSTRESRELKRDMDQGKNGFVACTKGGYMRSLSKRSSKKWKCQPQTLTQ